MDSPAFWRLKNHIIHLCSTHRLWQLHSLEHKKSKSFVQIFHLLCDFLLHNTLFYPVWHVDHPCFIWFPYKNWILLSHQTTHFINFTGTAFLYLGSCVPILDFDTSNNTWYINRANLAVKSNFYIVPKSIQFYSPSISILPFMWYNSSGVTYSRNCRGKQLQIMYYF